MTNKWSRSYTNSEGETVVVCFDHLDKAVDIKLELQNMSPSRKCNWKQHKQMMETEGFTNSDVNESYRCLVKAYQKEQGKLSSLPTYAEMVATSKLESIKQAVGNMYQEKRENQMVLNDLNKLKRDLVTTAVVAEQVRDAFLDDMDWRIPHFEPVVPTNFSNEMFVVLTDLHIGALVDNVYGNSYNYAIAWNRIEAYLVKIAEYVRIFNIRKINLVILGDLIEHVYMRLKQQADVEFTMAQQIVKATELILWFIVQLSKLAHVEVESIAGNHDRMNGNKDLSLDDDNANVIINQTVAMMINSHNATNINFIEPSRSATEIHKEVHGRVFKFVHGHLDNGNKRDRLKGYISMTNEFVDCLVYGHLHNWRVEDSDNGRLTVGIGSIMGRNNYSKAFNCATDASQGIIIVKNDGEILPIRIGLQIN